MNKYDFLIILKFKKKMAHEYYLANFSSLTIP
jgi:hypothetical protein